MNKTRIDWPWKPLYTWNPVVGCKHGCSYCYAEKISNRLKMIPKWEEPKFFRDRLGEPKKHKKHRNIFVGSMCDLFGNWVPRDWIDSVILTAHYNQQHTFIFLTKNPKRYSEFSFPKNCWLGCTITCIDDIEGRQHYNYIKLKNNKFISMEPLLGHFKDYDFNGVDMVIIGAMTGPGAALPKREWIESIKHPNIHYKNNIRKYL